MRLPGAVRSTRKTLIAYLEAPWFPLEKPMPTYCPVSPETDNQSIATQKLKPLWCRSYSRRRLAMAAAAAALRHAVRRLASQRPPALMSRAAAAEQPLRRLLHGSSSARPHLHSRGGATAAAHCRAHVFSPGFLLLPPSENTPSVRKYLSSK